VSPSFTIISVSASLVMMPGTPKLSRRSEISFFLADTFIRIEPSWVTWGVTTNSKLAG
jgi:hypothetical protein